MKKYLLALVLALIGLLVSTSTFAGYRTIVLNSQNVINFNQPYTAEYVSKKQFELFNLAITSKEKDIYVVLNTPGGSVTAGNLFIDSIRALGKNVHTITIFAASMGYNTVQQLGKRYIIPSGVLMSHRASLGGLGGQFPGELNKRMDLYMKMSNTMAEKAAKRLGVSKSHYESLIHDELWLHSGEEAVASNNADEVVNVVCDSSLNGTFEESFNTFFGPIKATMSLCPIIIAPVSLDGSNEAIIKFKQQLQTYRTNIQSFL